jgi:hypothetical protein
LCSLGVGQESRNLGLGNQTVGVVEKGSGSHVVDVKLVELRDFPNRSEKALESALARWTKAPRKQKTYLLRLFNNPVPPVRVTLVLVQLLREAADVV